MTENSNIEKQIKRNIYGKPQSILVVFPPGLSVAANDEAQSILSNLWFQNKFPSEMTVQKNALRIDNIHMFAVMELLMRGKCFSDIRLIMSDRKVENVPSFEKSCYNINWDYYLASNMSLKIKVDVGGSPVLHEGAIKDILSDGLRDLVSSIVTGDSVEETTTLYVDIFRYHAVMSISLAGAPLYKRGYRSVLSHSAPLREDMAAACIQNALAFGLQNDESSLPDSMIIPFSGTGTFLIEYWMVAYQFSPVLFERTYAIQSMPLFRSENFNFLLKKAREHCGITELIPANYVCIDNADDANTALLGNIENFNQAVLKNQLTWRGDEVAQCVKNNDFIKLTIDSSYEALAGNIFIPINPPYGIRFGKSKETGALYQSIAKQINALSALTKANKKHVLGFILCPSEESWSLFCKTLTNATIDTYHLTQGGLDIRVAQFYL
tara:strand:+ start:2585 stop:3898 length:1314 start_codon:yes stop_codon:yes gene_type:complete